MADVANRAIPHHKYLRTPLSAPGPLPRLWTLDSRSQFIEAGLRTSDFDLGRLLAIYRSWTLDLGRTVPHDLVHDFLTTCFQNPPPENQWISTLFEIPTSTPARIFKGFTTRKCKIPRFHRGVHGFTTLAPQGGVPPANRARPRNRNRSASLSSHLTM